MSQLTHINLPDIGDFSNVPVIEIAVAVGDKVTEGDTIIVVESDKATLDIPADVSGTVTELKVAENDIVNEGSLILTLDTSGNVSEAEQPTPAQDTTNVSVKPEKHFTKNTETTADNSIASVPAAQTADTALPSQTATTNTVTPAYASPSVRRLARQLGADISEVVGSGNKNRILREDVKSYVKSRMTSTAGNAAVPMQLSSTLASIPAWPEVDYEQFGPITRQPLTRIGKIAGPALARNAIVIPHGSCLSVKAISKIQLIS